MAQQTIGADGEIRQDGQTAAEWLHSMFEFELCEECGHDEEDHEVRLDVFGLFHSYCLKPAEDAA